INFVEKVNKSPEKKTMFESVANFVDQMMPLANKAASKIGLDPKILLAQAALETGWGKHIIHDSNGKPSYNLFGIKDSKSWQGESVKIDTLEVESGEFVKRKENFRSYSSFEKSFEDFIQFISESPRYQGAMKLVHDAKAFITSIQDAGYATDPQYANKIINIFNRNLVD
ncbi:MAG: flagellar assembly peptidoglycan hydrolase FlgJ, partial [Kangiellaceae bacterium]